jgi:hypothetical protein
VAGGKAREVMVKGWVALANVWWAADGKGLFVSTVRTSGRMLLYVDLERRANVLWEHKRGGWFYNTWGVPSPNGRYLALTGFHMERYLWMLENF